MLITILFLITVVCIAIFFSLIFLNVYASKKSYKKKICGELQTSIPKNVYNFLNSSFEKNVIQNENLSLEAQKLIDTLWNSSETEIPYEQKCVEKFGITLFRHDLLKLKSGDWINDEIINFYMILIVDRSKRFQCFPKTYAFNTFFYITYIEKGYNSVKKWTKNLDIFLYDIIIVPIHQGAHWCLAVIDMKKKKIEYYDSMLSDGTSCLLTLRDYLVEEHVEKRGSALDALSWTLRNKKDIPTQKKGYDCGVFACRFAESASRRAPIQFNQDNMDLFRAKMTYEIYTAKLLI